jgi:hypothetical protein
MWYFRGALPNPPLSEDLGMILFLFFSSASAQAFNDPSLLMVALASSLYDMLGNIFRQSYSSTVSPLWNRFFLLVCVDMVGPVLEEGVELASVVIHGVVPLLQI